MKKLIASALSVIGLISLYGIVYSATQETIVLTNTSSNATIVAGSDAIVYGTAGANSITLENGAKAKLFNFPGNNIVIIQADSSLFTVSRSGAYVTFDGTDGTVLKMPTSEDIQIITFDGVNLELVIQTGKIMLGNQEIDTTPAAINDLSQNNNGQITTQIIAATGQAAPGFPEGSVYRSVGEALSGAQMGGNDQIFFPGTVNINEDSTQKTIHAVWFGSPDSLQVIAREDDIISGVPGNILFSRASSAVITSSGHVAFLGLLKGAVKSNSTAILAWVDGRLIKVIGSNDPAPGFPAGTFVSHDALNSFNNFAFSDAGMVIYGLVAPFAQAIWYWDFNETSLLAALKSEGNFGVGMVDEKAPFPLIGCDYYRVGMITPLSKLFINDKGDIIVDAIAISLDDTIDCPPLMTLNFKDSKAEIILQSNDQFPLNNGEFFNSLRTNHLNQAGGVNSLIGMGGTASAWYLSGDNELNLVALGGEYLPPDYTKSILPISGITPFAITSSSGRSVVSGIAVGGKYILAGSPRPSLPYSRIDQPENSHLDLIAKTNMHPPTFPETSFFSDLGEPIITNGGDIFFNAEIKSAVDNSSVHSIWRVKTDNSMQCILKTGQEIDVNGELMTLDRMYFGNSDSMQLKQFSDTGKFALRVRFVENWNDYIMVVGYK